MESVSRIVGVESVNTCLNDMHSRFVVRAIGDLMGIEDIFLGTLLRKDKNALDCEMVLRATGE